MWINISFQNGGNRDNTNEQIFGTEENNGRDFLIIQPAETPSPTSQTMITTYMDTVSLQSPRPLESPRFASSEPLADLAYAAEFRSEILQEPEITSTQES